MQQFEQLPEVELESDKKYPDLKIHPA